MFIFKKNVLLLIKTIIICNYFYNKALFYLTEKIEGASAELTFFVG